MSRTAVQIERSAAAAAHADVTTDPGHARRTRPRLLGCRGVRTCCCAPHGRDAIAPIMWLAARHTVAIVPRGERRTVRAA